MCRWLRGSNVPKARWLPILSAHMAGPTASWMNSVEMQVYTGQRQPLTDLHIFARELQAAFEPAARSETAHKKLHQLRRYGAVEAYVKDFTHWAFCLLEMAYVEQYWLFIEGLR